MPDLTLVSHHLCPYVQRAAIALTEKDITFRRIYIDLSNKPDWFAALSPLGKVPLLRVGDRGVVFESAVIVEYLEDTQGNPLHPVDPLDKARHRGWIEYASSILNDIAGLYSAPTPEQLAAKRLVLQNKIARLEPELAEGPYFSGEQFSLVDAAFAPVFRYFDTFERGGISGFFDCLPKVAAWRGMLSKRYSVITAAPEDYAERLEAFLIARKSAISNFYC